MLYEDQNAHNLKQQYDELENEIADILLGTDSPVRGFAEFDKLISEHDRLLSRQAVLKALETKLTKVLPGLEQAEGNLTAAQKHLAAEKKKMADYASELGESAFAGLRSGELPDHQIFSDRKDLQSRIENLQHQRSELTSGENAGMMVKAKLQAQQLKLKGQIKLEELRINSVDRSLGEALLKSKEKISVRCDQTEDVIRAISAQQKVIAKVRGQVKQAENLVEEHRKAAGTTLDRKAVEGITSLKSDLKEIIKQLQQNEEVFRSVREQLVDKSLESDIPLKNSILTTRLSELKELKQNLDSDKSRLVELFHSMREQWKYLPRMDHRTALGLVSALLVVIVSWSFWPSDSQNNKSGGTFIAGPDNFREISPKVVENVASEVLAEDSTKYNERGFKGLVFGQTKDEVRSFLEANPPDTKQDLPKLFFDEGRLIGYRQRYRGDNNFYLLQIRKLFGNVNRDHITQASGSSSMLAPDPSAMWSGTWQMKRVASGWQSIAVRYYFPQVVAYGYAEWKIDSRDVRPREDLHLSIWDKEWLDNRLKEHASHCTNVLSWIESTRVALSNDGDMSSLRYSDSLLTVETDSRTSREMTPEGLGLFSAESDDGSPETKLRTLQRNVENLEKHYTALDEIQAWLRSNPDKATMNAREEPNRLKRLIEQLEPRIRKFMELAGFDPEENGRISEADMAEFKRMIGIVDKVRNQIAYLKLNGHKCLSVSRDFTGGPSGSITVDIDLSHLPTGPGKFYETLLDRNYIIEVDQCNLKAAQIMFPPKRDSIGVRKANNEHLQVYSWQTSDGWTVSVLPRNQLRLTNHPMRSL